MIELDLASFDLPVDKLNRWERDAADAKENVGALGTQLQEDLQMQLLAAYTALEDCVEAAERHMDTAAQTVTGLYESILFAQQVYTETGNTQADAARRLSAYLNAVAANLQIYNDTSGVLLPELTLRTSAIRELNEWIAGEPAQVEISDIAAVSDFVSKEYVLGDAGSAAEMKNGS